MEWEKRSAYVYIKTFTGKTETVYDKIKEFGNTIGVFMTSGNYDLVWWVDTQDVKDAYNWISQVRGWPEVEWTSTYQTHYGYRNETGYWEKPYIGWFKVRTKDFTTTYDEWQNSDWVGVATSITGDYDWICMFYGDTYEELYKYMYELKIKGYEYEYYPVLKYYWNTEYQQKWQEFTTTTYQTQN